MRAISSLVLAPVEAAKALPVWLGLVLVDGPEAGHRVVSRAK
jgi:hypothetical protein